MLKIYSRATARLFVAPMLIVSLISIAAPHAFAFGPLDDKSKEAAIAPHANNNENAASAETRPRRVTEPKSPEIAYALYSEALKPRPEMVLAADTPQLEGVLNRVSSLKTIAARNDATTPLPAVPPAASTAPMTSGEKFKFWAKRFVSPGSYGTALASGLWNELLDNDEGKKDTVENYFADAMTRAARSYAFGTTAGFFEKFAYASLFRQDPRYHRSDKRGLGGKMGYAVSRTFITQGDRCGCDQFNISFLAGGLTAAGISNLWEREERQTVGKTLSRWGTHIALTALSNVIREFIGGQ